MIRAFKKRLTAALVACENTAIPFSSIVLTLAAVVSMRNLIEDYSDNHIALSQEILWGFYTHIVALYIAEILSFLLIFRIATGLPLHKLLNIVACGFVLWWVAPIADLLVGGIGEQNMIYFQPNKDYDLLHNFFTFFGEPGSNGITIGQRIMIAAILLGSWGYLLLRNVGWVRSTLYAGLIYVLIFAMAIMPIIASWIMEPFHIVDFSFSNYTLRRMYLIIAAAELTGLYAITYPAYFRALWKDLRLLRLFHCMLLYVLGIIIAWKQELFTVDYHTFFNFPVGILAIFFTYLYVLIADMIADAATDTPANGAQPFPARAVPADAYKAAGWWSLVVVAFLSLGMGIGQTVLIGASIASFHLYSTPPLRLKRIPFLSKLFMAIGLTLFMLTGYVTAGANLDTFPYTFLIGSLLAFTAILNIGDVIRSARKPEAERLLIFVSLCVLIALTLYVAQADTLA